jgi:excisionase family DNA binding protein
MGQIEQVLVDVGTAATALGMGRSSLYRMCRAGKIPSYAAGPRGRGVRLSLQECLQALRRPTQEQAQ